MYGNELAGRKTASGEPFDPTALTMAHRTLPFGTHVRVTNLENQRSVEVVVNDRGPFASGRIADLSEAAARRIGMVADGVVEALLDILQPGKGAKGTRRLDGRGRCAVQQPDIRSVGSHFAPGLIVAPIACHKDRPCPRQAYWTRRLSLGPR